MLTLTELANEVRRIAKDRPQVSYKDSDEYGYISGVCTDNTCGCLIGQAILNLGKQKGLLGGYYSMLNNIDNLGGLSNTDIETVVRINPFAFYIDDYRVLHWLCVVQEKQDKGLNWGECVE